MQDCITVPSVSQADSSAISVQLHNRGRNVPAGNTLSAIATYAAASAEPRTRALQASILCLKWFQIAGTNSMHMVTIIVALDFLMC